MRLSPVIVSVVAFAAYAGTSLSANAQTANNSTENQKSEVVTFQDALLTAPDEVKIPTNAPKPQETAKVVISQKNQDPESEVIAVFPASSMVTAKPKETAKVVISQKNQDPESEVVAVFPASATVTAKPKETAVVIPTKNQQSEAVAVFSTSSPTQGSASDLIPQRRKTQTTAQTRRITPNPTNLPRVSDPAFVQVPPTINQEPATPTPTQTPQPTVPPVNQQPTQPTQPTVPPVNQQPEPSSPNTPPSDTPQNIQPQAPEATETRVLVSEVVVRPESGQLTKELENQVYKAIRTQPGRTTTRSQLQEDINAIFATGFFSNVQATPEDTPLGVRVSFVVQPNPVLTKVQIEANPGTNIASVIPATAIDEIFKEQYGNILNLRNLQEGVKQLTKRYQDQGYVLANVIGAPKVSSNGVVTLQIAEGVVENVRVRFRNKDGQETDEKGQPLRGRTQEYIVTRELQLKPGQVFNRNIVQRDLQRVFGLGLFEDLNISLDPGTDPSKVNVVVNVVERNSGSIAAGAGISSASGLFGTISYQEQNLGGRNQKLGAELQVGVRELLFDLRFTDPWIGGDPFRTSYTANVFRRRSLSLIFDGPKENIDTFDPNNPTADGDRPRVVRTGGGINFTRPLSRNPYENSEWTASAGFQYQRISTKDDDGNIRNFGRVNGDPNTQVDLSASGTGQDDLLLFQLGAARDKRNNPLQPTSGSFFRIGLDQSVPIGLGNIFLTRLRGSYSQYIPVKFTNFTKGAQALAFNIQGGTVLGDLPPYEAFTLGGSSSVRGYEEGQLGAGRSFVQASVEYRFPVFSVVSGALFFDVGSDLGTSSKASEILNKNGTGYGYGLGVRVQSPLGPIRIDYGINDSGDSRINFGIGERF
jgi:outer membrane protein insertion porin family